MSDHLDPVAYETHSGVVLLLGNRAYKAKKAIRTPYLDFGSVERRRAACERELALNRRLAPDVYLGVGSFTARPGGPAEPVLVMRRLPESTRLSLLARSSAPIGTALTQLVDLLVRFHTSAPRGPHIDREAYPDALRARWQANLAETAELGAGIVPAARMAAITRLALAYLHGREPLFRQRIADHRVVDGHGDLIADDVFCLPDGPRVLDCLDFDDRLRYVDVADDIAFLQMDLEFLDRPDLARQLAERYTAATGDGAPGSLRHHFIAYRAMVRAKVDCLRYRQGRAESAAEAQRHASLALAHLNRGCIRVVLVGGLPGTGKSTLARALARRVGAVLISSDSMRRELVRQHRIGGAVGGFGEGLYSAAHRAQVYAAMLERADHELRWGNSVVLDASWGAADDRERARRCAREAGAVVLELRCRASRAIADARIHQRRGGDSDATAEVAHRMSAGVAPWPEATDVDTTRDIADCVSAVEQLWSRAVPRARDERRDSPTDPDMQSTMNF